MAAIVMSGLIERCAPRVVLTEELCYDPGPLDERLAAQA